MVGNLKDNPEAFGIYKAITEEAQKVSAKPKADGKVVTITWQSENGAKTHTIKVIFKQDVDLQNADTEDKILKMVQKVIAVREVAKLEGGELGKITLTSEGKVTRTFDKAAERCIENMESNLSERVNKHPQTKLSPLQNTELAAYEFFKTSSPAKKEIKMPEPQSQSNGSKPEETTDKTEETDKRHTPLRGLTLRPDQIPVTSVDEPSPLNINILRKTHELNDELEKEMKGKNLAELKDLKKVFESKIDALGIPLSKFSHFKELQELIEKLEIADVNKEKIKENNRAVLKEMDNAVEGWKKLEKSMLDGSFEEDDFSEFNEQIRTFASRIDTSVMSPQELEDYNKKKESFENEVVKPCEEWGKNFFETLCKKKLSPKESQDKVKMENSQKGWTKDVGNFSNIEAIDSFVKSQEKSMETFLSKNGIKLEKEDYGEFFPTWKELKEKLEERRSFLIKNDYEMALKMKGNDKGMEERMQHAANEDYLPAQIFLLIQPKRSHNLDKPDEALSTLIKKATPQDFEALSLAIISNNLSQDQKAYLANLLANQNYLPAKIYLDLKNPDAELSTTLKKNLKDAKPEDLNALVPFIYTEEAKEPQKAILLAKTMAEKGSVQASIYLVLNDPKTSDKDKEEALKKILDKVEPQKLEENLKDLSSQHLSKLIPFIKKYEETSEYAKAFNLAKVIAKIENEEVQYLVGKFYQQAIGTEEDRNPEKAFEYFLKAANHGHKDAMRSLSEMYKEGDGVAKDDEQAKFWRESADPVNDF